MTHSTYKRDRRSWADERGGSTIETIIESFIVIAGLSSILYFGVPLVTGLFSQARTLDCAKNLVGTALALPEANAFCPLTDKPYKKEIRDGQVVVSCPNPEQHFIGFPVLHWDNASSTARFGSPSPTGSEGDLPEEFTAGAKVFQIEQVEQQGGSYRILASATFWWKFLHGPLVVFLIGFAGFGLLNAFRAEWKDLNFSEPLATTRTAEILFRAFQLGAYSILLLLGVACVTGAVAISILLVRTVEIALPAPAAAGETAPVIHSYYFGMELTEPVRIPETHALFVARDDEEEEATFYLLYPSPEKSSENSPENLIDHYELFTVPSEHAPALRRLFQQGRR